MVQRRCHITHLDCHGHDGLHREDYPNTDLVDAHFVEHTVMFQYYKYFCQPT